MFNETYVWRERPANSRLCPKYVPATKTSQVPEIIPLEMELQGVIEVLENDEGDNIDHSHIPPTPLETENSHSSNLDTEFMPRKSGTRQRPKLLTGFEYTAWLTTAFLSGYKVSVLDPSI